MACAHHVLSLYRNCIFILLAAILASCSSKNILSLNSTNLQVGQQLESNSRPIQTTDSLQYTRPAITIIEKQAVKSTSGKFSLSQHRPVAIINKSYKGEPQAKSNFINSASALLTRPNIQQALVKGQVQETDDDEHTEKYSKARTCVSMCLMVIILLSLLFIATGALGLFIQDTIDLTTNLLMLGAVAVLVAIFIYLQVEKD